MAAGGAHGAFPPVLDQKTASCTAAALEQRGCYEISVPAVRHCQEKNANDGRNFTLEIINDSYSTRKSGSISAWVGKQASADR